MSRAKGHTPNSSVFQINAPREGSAAIGDPSTGEPLKAACKDCDEWQCWSCDNENCHREDKEVNVEDCAQKKDTLPTCKDCDEWQCWSCDNENQKK